MSLVDKIKSLARKSILATALGISASGFSGKADAGEIMIRNRGPPLTFSECLFSNLDGATDGDDPYDLDYMQNPNSFEIYSKIGDTKVAVNSKPTNTHGFDFYLSVTNPVNNNTNGLKYTVNNSTGLTEGEVKMWDLANPSEKYDLVMDGLLHDIPLPNLTSPAGEYAHWYLQLREQGTENPVSEPISLFGSALGLYALSKLGRRKE